MVPTMFNSYREGTRPVALFLMTEYDMSRSMMKYCRSAMLRKRWHRRFVKVFVLFGHLVFVIALRFLCSVPNSALRYFMFQALRHRLLVLVRLGCICRSTAKPLRFGQEVARLQDLSPSLLATDPTAFALLGMHLTNIQTRCRYRMMAVLRFPEIASLQNLRPRLVEEGAPVELIMHSYLFPSTCLAIN